MGDKIIILDFGGQYTHLIARRIRQLNVYSEIVPSDTPVEELKNAKGIILSGGPFSVYYEKPPKPDKKLFELDIPVLGLCYGHQLIAFFTGGKVKSGRTKEYGIAELDIKDDKDLFSGMEKKQTVWMSHGDKVEKLPKGFEILASTSDCEIAAMGNGKYFGLQFHPEVTHTVNGMKILENFVFKICKCEKNWTMHNFIEQKINEIKEKVNEKNVFLLVSGGVDSTVCFTLLTKALGDDRVMGLHVDNGLMRKDEVNVVKKSLNRFKNLHIVDASEDFLNGLKDVIDPEKKREIIGNKFMEVANKSIGNLKLDPEKWVLAQGTIYPDTIETKGTEHADLIKTHHNRVKLAQELIKQGKVIEPISLLYKDEVREVGLELGLPEELVWRHPFPGPGLGVRCLCSNGEEKIENKDEIEKKLNELVRKHNLTAKVLPIKSVGVQGDNRTYAHPALLTGKADWRLLEKVSTEITNKIKDINRVVYLINPKELMGCDFSLIKASITKERLSLLRECDEIAMNALKERHLYDDVWQMPTVLIPLTLCGAGESIVLRPVSSKEAMTASFSKLPIDAVEDIAEKIVKQGIDTVMYDVTNKPPGTIEWE